MKGAIQEIIQPFKETMLLEMRPPASPAQPLCLHLNAYRFYCH